jgi:hypothetical protein
VVRVAAEEDMDITMEAEVAVVVDVEEEVDAVVMVEQERLRKTRLLPSQENHMFRPWTESCRNGAVLKGTGHGETELMSLKTAPSAMLQMLPLIVPIPIHLRLTTTMVGVRTMDPGEESTSVVDLQDLFPMQWIFKEPVHHLTMVANERHSIMVDKGPSCPEGDWATSTIG